MIEGQINEADFLAVFRLHGKARWRGLIVIWLLGAAAIPLGWHALQFGLLAPLVAGTVGLGLLVGLPAGLVLALLSYYVALPRNVRRSWVRGSTRELSSLPRLVTAPPALGEIGSTCRLCD